MFPDVSEHHFPMFQITISRRSLSLFSSFSNHYFPMFLIIVTRYFRLLFPVLSAIRVQIFVFLWLSASNVLVFCDSQRMICIFVTIDLECLCFLWFVTYDLYFCDYWFGMPLFSVIRIQRYICFVTIDSKCLFFVIRIQLFVCMWLLD